MSAVHRRVLTAADVRCHPDPECPLQQSCARFTHPLPQGLGATMNNFSAKVSGGYGQKTCPEFLSHMVTDDQLAIEAAAKKAVKPPIGAKK